MNLSESSINEIKEFITTLVDSDKISSVCGDICNQVILSFEYLEFNERTINKVITDLRNIKDPCNIPSISSIINKIRLVCGTVLQNMENKNK